MLERTRQGLPVVRSSFLAVPTGRMAVAATNPGSTRCCLCRRAVQLTPHFAYPTFAQLARGPPPGP